MQCLQLQQQITHLSQLIKASRPAVAEAGIRAVNGDRQNNVIAFGIQESLDWNACRDQMMKVLCHAAGHEILVWSIGTAQQSGHTSSGEAVGFYEGRFGIGF